MNASNTINPITDKDIAFQARVKQLASSAKATAKKNPQASPCTILRVLAKHMPHVGRQEFLAVFVTDYSLTPNSVSHQFYAGRNH